MGEKRLLSGVGVCVCVLAELSRGYSCGHPFKAMQALGQSPMVSLPLLLFIQDNFKGNLKASRIYRGPLSCHTHILGHLCCYAELN